MAKGSTYDAEEEEIVQNATIEWHKQDPKSNQLRVTRGRHGSTEKYSIQWKEFLNPRVPEKTRLKISQWSSETLMAEFINICKLVKGEKVNVQENRGVRSKRRRVIEELSQDGEVGEEEQEGGSEPIEEMQEDEEDEEEEAAWEDISGDNDEAH